MSEDQRKKEARPESQDAYRLADEEMAQVTGGTKVDFPGGLDFDARQAVLAADPERMMAILEMGHGGH